MFFQNKSIVDFSQVTGGKRKFNQKIQLGGTARLLKSKSNVSNKMLNIITKRELPYL